MYFVIEQFKKTRRESDKTGGRRGGGAKAKERDRIVRRWADNATIGWHVSPYVPFDAAPQGSVQVNSGRRGRGGRAYGVPGYRGTEVLGLGTL